MATNWKIDNLHSEVGFKVRHMMISNVRGNFAEFDASAETNDDSFDGAKFAFSAKIASINTGVADRDGHLKSPDFFDEANYPELKFVSTNAVNNGDGNFEIVGEMEIRGVKKEVKLKADFSGVAVDPYGQTKVGFSIEGKIKRSEFGLQWSAVTEAGSIVVGDEVTLLAELQFVKA